MISDAVFALRRALEALRDTPSLCATRVEVPVSARPTLNWLATNSHLATQWWADRDRTVIRAGLGIADCETSPYYTPVEVIAERIEAKLKWCSQFCYVGGIRFPSEFPVGSDWKSFGYYRFVLPLFEWVQTPTGSVLACNWVQKPYLTLEAQLAFVLAQLDSLQFTPRAFRTTPRVMSRHDFPSHWEWLHRVQTVQQEIAAELYQKLVPARQTTLELSGGIHPAHLLSRLETQGDCEGLFQFILQSAPDSSFVGISPERLYRRVDRALYTEALAGTYPRHEEPGKLLVQQNTQDEHHWVAHMLQDALRSMSSAYQFVTEKRVLTLPRVHHLYQPFQTQLKPEITDGMILRALYPTPAVAGYPVNAALARIATLDHFDRGLYSGIVGTWSSSEVHWAVGIRSAWVGEHRLDCYTGAGIVSTSKAENEWAELEEKLRPFTEVLAC